MILGIIGFAGLAAIPQIILCGTALIAVLCIEVPRSLGIVDVQPRDVLEGCRRFMSYCAPEAIGLATVFLVAVGLRLRGDLKVPTTPLAMEIWTEIKEEWPVLMGADTLLNLQSMLRFLIFACAAYRARVFPLLPADKNKSVPDERRSNGGSAIVSPVSGIGAALFVCGMLARAQASSRSDSYRLEGPLGLGGDLSVFCDLCSVPLLLALAFTSLRPKSGSPVLLAMAIGFAIWVSSQNHLNLSKDPSTDSLFTLTYVTDCFAALAFLHRAIMQSFENQHSERGHTFIAFVHVVMAFQQALSAYYFLTAFEPSPKVVGAGQPFCVLIWSNVLSLGAYFFAAALYFGGLFADGPGASNSIRTDTGRASLGDASPTTAITSHRIPAVSDVSKLLFSSLNM